MNYDTDGAELFRGALKAQFAECETALAPLPAEAAGLRLRKVQRLDPLLASGGPIGSVAAAVLGEKVRPVRAILFNKTPQTNWALAWHQDRTICVSEQRETSGFGPWTIKSGMHHVAPPFDLLARMVTLRAHLDDVPAGNAPLLVAPGSHRFGRVTERDINEVVRQCGTRACLAKAGDVWLYATPILHASDAAASPAKRRVLQVDYAAEALPNGLEWLGV